MNLIRILPENVASQIAAGEVIDRPASVVRELIDNSIDASANRIVIRIERGGKGLIRVSDNGVGMSKDDLLLCIERHATSKIEKLEDLFSVRSFGFRGEAIPSIASVSRMQITSRPEEQLEAFRLKIAGGKLTAIEKTGTPVGTIVEVRDLFFNVPARRKFLRAPKTEMDHIVDTLSRSALSFPGISFKLEDAGKTIMNLPTSDKILNRLFALMGRRVAESMVQAEEEFYEISVGAHLAPPELSRTRGDRLYVYVNNRNVRDRLITKAIMDGYGQRLMKGSYPQAVVFIKMDPSVVDFNVHPTKQEVRFHNSRNVFQAVASTIDKALSQSLRPSFMLEAHAHQGMLDHLKKNDLSFVSEPAKEYRQGTFGTAVPIRPEIPERPVGLKQPFGKSMITQRPQVIGQLGRTYILCQVKNGLTIVDQHAAHERILYENLKKDFSTSYSQVQTLLLPYEIELSAKEARLVIDRGHHLAQFGIELDHFGGNTFLLRSHPALLRNINWDLFLSEFLAAMEEGEPIKDEILNKLLTVMACHGAVRAGDPMTHEEMLHLINQLDEIDLPTNCPHGRPVFQHFTYYEIEKMFKRI